jgi:farnesyl diphosphate synthase
VPLVENSSDQLLTEFESFLNFNLPTAPSFHPVFDEALKEMFKAGGKRFRPLMLLQIVEACQPSLIKNAYHIAAAIEMLHTYSLIHDDLPTFDDSNLRRGHPTLHVTYDEVTATLVGDALNSHSFLMIANAPLSSSVKIELIKELSINGGTSGMVLGQAIDCHFENTPLEIEQIRILHVNKTAKLIAASLQMGAIICSDSALEKKLYDFGIDLGLLFQIQDDILDVTQSSQEAGKLTNNDEDKNSFVTILGLDESMKQANEIADELTLEMANFEQNLQSELSSLLTKYINRHKN